jgi:hypothetical protein
MRGTRSAYMRSSSSAWRTGSRSLSAAPPRGSASERRWRAACQSSRATSRGRGRPAPAAPHGPEWSRVYRRVADDPYDHLKEYYKRNLCETMYACDKRRFGRTIRQRREDRQEMAMAGIAILHNVFTTRVPP